MKELFIEDLKKGDTIFGENFAVKSYRKSATRNNKPYIDLELVDKTGSVKAKIWSDDMATCKTAKEGDVVSVSGTIEEFQGRLQMKITNLQPIDNFELEDYQMISINNTEEMFKEVRDNVSGIKNPHLKKLFENIFEDNDFVENFKKGSAAYTVHHNYVGGLLEHTLEVLEVSKSLIKKFPKLNEDLLISGAILHDVGKVKEFEIGTTIKIKKEGKLLGHIFLGAEFIKSKASEDMPADLLYELLHLVLSHHGELQFGSPVVPMTAEAVALFTSDYTSSRVNMAYTAIHSGEISDEFTEYHRQLGTQLYRSPFIDTLLNEDIPF